MEQSGGGQVAAVTRVSSAHHVLGVEHLLSQFRNGQSAVLLRTTGSQRRETGHEEVQTRERDHVDRDLTQVAVQLTREANAAGHSGHSGRDQVVQVTVRRRGQLQSTEADVVQSFVVHHHDFVSVFHQLVEGQHGVVRLDNGIRHLRRRNDGEGFHDTIRVFFADLGDQERTHTGTGTTTQGVDQLEALQAVAAFRFLTNDVQDGVDHTRFEVHQDSTGDVTTTGSFVEVHVDALQLQVGVTVVGTRRVNAVFIGDDFPELGTDLVTALTSLDVDEFTHFVVFCFLEANENGSM